MSSSMQFNEHVVKDVQGIDDNGRPQLQLIPNMAVLNKESPNYGIEGRGTTTADNLDQIIAKVF